MVEILKKKRVIIPILFVLIITVSGLISFVALNNITTHKEGTKKEKSTPKPAPTPKPAKAPEPTLPQICTDQTEVVKQILSGEVKSTGSTSKAEDGSHLTQCGYYADKSIVTVRIHEYPDEAQAKAAVQSRKIGGYVTQEKGRYIVLVSAASETGPNTEGANKILSSILGRLQ